jgi:hypothetical protein
MTNTSHEDRRVRDKSYQEMKLFVNPNRLMGFWGNLCGLFAAFFSRQAEKHGDYFEND